MDWELPKRVHGLHLVAWFGLSRLISRIVEGAENPEVIINYQEAASKQTPLMWACRKGHAEVVEQLIKLGADVNLVDAKGRTALWEAIRKNSRTSVLALLQSPKLYINASNLNTKNRTALMLACSLGYVEIVQCLLHNCANIDVNQTDSEGYTALSIAAGLGHKDIVNQLIASQEIKLDLVINNTGYSALSLAAQRDYAEIVEQLLRRGADPKLRDNQAGGTALLRAVEYGNLSVTQVMLHHSVDPLCTDDNGRTLLHGATEAGDSDIMALLIQRGAKVNAQDNNGCTALHEAGQKGIYTAVDFLLKSDADPNIKDNFGRTPFILALQYGMKDVKDLMMENLTDIHIPE
jgi:serine/threonine-protein phosphatase 6 regulatory ankyrin repeat subunit B